MKWNVIKGTWTLEVYEKIQKWMRKLCLNSISSACVPYSLHICALLYPEGTLHDNITLSREEALSSPGFS